MTHLYSTNEAHDNTTEHHAPRRQTLDFLRQFSRTILPGLPTGCIVIN